MKSATAALPRDDLLVSRARQGDRDAFGRLIAPRAHRLLRTACAILGQEAEARDAAQETLLAAWINLPNLRDASRFDAWLNRVLLNQCRDALRRRKRSREVQLDVSDHTSPDHAEASTETTAVLRAFDRIGLADRHLLVLHHLHGMPLTEIAAQLGVPVGTTKSRLWSARQALERALEAEA
jgi:RNA polymerase sigma-70 factor (ECF subfamily)